MATIADYVLPRPGFVSSSSSTPRSMSISSPRAQHGDQKDHRATDIICPYTVALVILQLHALGFNRDNLAQHAASLAPGAPLTRLLSHAGILAPLYASAHASAPLWEVLHHIVVVEGISGWIAVLERTGVLRRQQRKRSSVPRPAALVPGRPSSSNSLQDEWVWDQDVIQHWEADNGALLMWVLRHIFNARLGDSDDGEEESVVGLNHVGTVHQDSEATADNASKGAGQQATSSRSQETFHSQLPSQDTAGDSTYPHVYRLGHSPLAQAFDRILPFSSASNNHHLVLSAAFRRLLGVDQDDGSTDNLHPMKARPHRGDRNRVSG